MGGIITKRKEVVYSLYDSDCCVDSFHYGNWNHRQELKDNNLTSRKIELTQEMVDGLTSVIQLKGFHCPEVKLAYQRDTDVYGDNSKVWCGKKNSDDVFEKAVFRVTITPKYDETKSPMDISVVPWTDEMSDW